MSSTEIQSGKQAVKKKVCILGATGAGKTSLVRQYVHGIFDEQYKSTIGVNIEEMNVTVDGRVVKLMIWDVEGYDDPLEEYDKRSDFIPGTNAYVLVMDGTRPATYDMARTIQQLVQQQLTPQHSAPIQSNELPFIAIVNKCDLARTNDFHVEGWTVYETSAKTGENVPTAFETLVRKMLQVDRNNSDRGGETLKAGGTIIISDSLSE
jgi:small GTP-binding protein